MKSKPIVLIIENSIDVTGALKSIVRTACDLKFFFDFEFFIPRNSKSRPCIESKKFAIHEVPMRELSRRFSDLFFYFPTLFINTFRLNKLINQRQISIIHVNDLYNLLPVTLRLLGNSTPYVCHIRFMPDRFPSWLFNFWLTLHLRFAEKVVAVSYRVKQRLPVHPKIIVIHNELPENESVFVKTEDDKPNSTFLYLSNFMKGKGQNYALEAFACIHQNLPEWKLRFVGGDMGLERNKVYLKSLKRRAEVLGIAFKIEWASFTEAVEWEYKLADIVLNFSESESFSITCLEALFFGRPLIATDCGGPAEIIDHGETGLLVMNRNLYEMVRAMNTLAMDEKMRNEMGLKARQVVREKFSMEKTTFRVKEIYDFVLKKE